MPRLAVIGGSGLLGSHLIAALEREGWSASSIDRVPFPKNAPRPPGFWELCGDALDTAKLAETLKGADAVWIKAAKLAGDRHDDDALPAYKRINVALPQKVMEMAGKMGIPRIYLDSSDAVFLDTWTEGNHLPDSPPCPKDHYGRTKAEAESLLKEWAMASDDRSGQIVRYSRVRAFESGGVLALWCAQASLGLPLRLFGDGSRAGCAIHLDDCVRGSVAALSLAPRFATYNLTLPPITLSDLSSIVAQLLGETGVSYDDDPSDPTDPQIHAMDPGDSWKRLGIVPRVSYDQMVEETAAFVKERLEGEIPPWVRPFKNLPGIQALIRISLIAASRKRGIPL